MDAEPERLGLCYFIGNVEVVKIGFSADVYRRLPEIMTRAALFDLDVLATARGHRYREAYYHQQFDAHRLGGEWFARVPEIEAEIARLQSLAEGF
jgi:hypothetical protein